MRSLSLLALLLMSPLAAHPPSPCPGPPDPLTGFGGLQDPDYAALAKKCGSEIPWNVDPYEARDEVPRGAPPEPAYDRRAALDEARKKAADEKKLVLVYVYRVKGRHMYRAPILEKYMDSVVWSDPDVVALVKSRFVPLRLYADEAVTAALGVRGPKIGEHPTPETVEPAILVLDPEAKVLLLLNRLRTFNADWVRWHLARTAGVETGNGEGPYEKAVALRLARKGDQALESLKGLDTPEASAERGLILLRQAKLKDAREALRGAAGGRRAAEAEYHLAIIDWLTGQDTRAVERWKTLAGSHSDTCWGWKAAMNLATWKDERPEGPVPHNFEDVFWAPEAAYEKTDRTRLSRGAADADDVAKRAVEWLLVHQHASGGWTDTRYAYWDSPKITPNVRVAVTALACAALVEWRDVDPKRIDEALAKGEKYAFDEANMARGQNEECYAEGYKLLYLARKRASSRDSGRRAAAQKAMEDVVKSIELVQKKDGLWSHEYNNPFTTAAVLNCLVAGRKEGAPVPDGLLKKGAEGLAKQRGKDGGYTYGAGRAPSGHKDSMARMAVCELALYACGIGSLEAIDAGLEAWWTHYQRFENIRVCDFHTDGELAGFFFFHGFFHSTEAAMVVKGRKDQQKKFLDELVKLPEMDGSFIDDHELGKSYATSMALLALKNCQRKK